MTVVEGSRVVVMVIVFHVLLCSEDRFTAVASCCVMRCALWVSPPKSVICGGSVVYFHVLLRALARLCALH